MVNTSKRKIILTTKSKAYFDIEEYYNTVKTSRQIQIPIIHRNTIMEDVKIEVMKGNEDEISVVDYGTIGVKGKGNTKICISCKKVVHNTVDPSRSAIGQKNQFNVSQQHENTENKKA